MSSSSSLPPEVFLQIFSLLPSKTLRKLRLVSKQFNSIISDPYLLRLHHRQALKSSSIITAFTGPNGSLTVEFRLFLFSKPNDVISAVLASLTAVLIDLFPEPHRNICQTLKPIKNRLLGSKVRVFSCNHQLIFFVTDKAHFLFDPIYQKFLEIPQSSSSPHPPDSFVSIGFVSSTLQYKIIRFFHHDLSICKFEVLTLRITGKNYSHNLEMSTWKSKEEQCPYLLEPYPPVHANGVLYWTTKKVPMIVCFSLEQEKFSVLSPPPCFEDNPSHDFSLCEIKGDLWVVDYNSHAPNMELWMMCYSNGSAWVKTHCINLKERFSLYYQSFPITIHDIKSDCVVFQVLFPSRLHVYHTRKNEVEDYGTLSCGDLSLCHYTDGFFVSLNCPLLDVLIKVLLLLKFS